MILDMDTDGKTGRLRLKMSGHKRNRTEEGTVNYTGNIKK